MSYDLSGLEISGVDFGADIAHELRAALSGDDDAMGLVSFGDDLGADDVLGALAEAGADPDTLGAVAEEIGRRRRRRARRGGGGGGRNVQAAINAAVARAVARKGPVERQGAAVLGGFGPVSAVNVNAKPTSMGGRMLPLTTPSIAAGSTFVATFSPQEDFRPERIIYAGPSSTFFLSDLRIKNNPQTIAAGEIPADAFTANAVDQRLNFSACPVGGQIQMAVRNATGVAAIFSAMMVGSAAIQG